MTIPPAAVSVKLIYPANIMVYGELGIIPLHLKIKARVLNFWYRMISGKKDKTCYTLYQLMHYLHVNDLCHSDWIKSVHETLDKLGFSNIWLTHNTFYSQASFKKKIKTRFADQFKQEWQNKVNETERCLNYRLYKKDFNFENYFNILPLPLAKYVCKFRCFSHKLPIEKERFLNIERNERICHICNKNELGDEFHYLFNCEYFSRSRLKLLLIWS